MTGRRQKILLLDTGREWGGGTNSMLELLKRIDRHRFDITCCFYHNYSRGEGETIAQALQAIGIDVCFIAQSRQPRWAKLSKELLRGLLFFSRPLKGAAARAVDLRWRVRPNAQAIADLLRSGGYDTLYMNNQPSTNVEGYLAAESVPIAVVQHCRIEPQMTPPLVRMVNRTGDLIIAVSHGVHRALCESGVAAEKCAVVANAIDIHQPLPDPQKIRQQYALPPHTFLFGTIGSLILRKANHHVLQALATFSAACPQAEWKLMIVGSGPEQQKLQQQAASLHIQDRVIFTGFQNNALDYLAAFDAFILASKSEGLPRVVLEAMLVNTAVIGSRVTGTAELITHQRTGLLFDYDDTATLGAQMQQLWQDAPLRKALVEAAGRSVREHYAIENYVAGVEQRLQSVMKGKPHV